MARGIYGEPADVLNRALDLLEFEEDWLSQNKEAIGNLLEDRWAESERGKSLNEDELPYVVIYRTRIDHVEIGAVLHGARNIKKILRKRFF